MSWDLIVIGGGAAGFFGAIAHAEAGGRVLILEKTGSPLAKVKVSGGGRCNVTHDCLEPRALVSHYPRGGKSLLGSLHRFGVEHTLAWFAERGVELKTEADGRIFPVSDRSQTIIDCLTKAAEEAGAKLRIRCGAAAIRREGEGFEVETEGGESLVARNVLIATGGTRLSASERLVAELGHTLEPAVPSLFTFKIEDPRLADLPGVSVAATECRIPGTKLRSSGPLLVTHSGVSGPGILRLSAWGARELAARDYRFSLEVNWVPGANLAATFESLRSESGKRRIDARSPFETIPKRFWSRLVAAAGIPADQTWANLKKAERKQLVAQLERSCFEVDGKSLNKEEFVTCGGVSLRDIDLKRMESKRIPGLFFAGEVMDVDGITGGFNFQNAWTSGYLAGTASASRASQVAEEQS